MDANWAELTGSEDCGSQSLMLLLSLEGNGSGPTGSPKARQREVLSPALEEK